MTPVKVYSPFDLYTGGGLKPLSDKAGFTQTSSKLDDASTQSANPLFAA
jgi:hypothetical protein